MLYQHRSDVFQDVAAYDYTSPGFNITGDRPEQIKGLHVSEGYFRLCGAMRVDLLIAPRAE